jgi:hypothetical protein
MMRGALAVLLALVCACGEPPRAPPDLGIPDEAPDLAPDAAPDAAPDEAPDEAPDLPAGPWRSAYYPEGWAPGDEAAGHRLHDYSWAGFAHGEAAPGAPADAPRLGVPDADPSGARDSGAAIQAALDRAGAAGGGVVTLGAGTYLIEDTLEIRDSGVVLRGLGSEATRLVFTRGEGMAFRAHVRVGGGLEVVEAGEVALAADGEAHATGVWVSAAQAAGLAPGSQVALGWFISPAFVAEHQMSGTWRVFNDAWQPIFWREVRAVTPDAEGRAWVELTVPLRYPAKVRDGASLRAVRGAVSRVGVEALGVSNAAPTMAEAWATDQVHAITLDGVRDGWVRGVSSFVSPRGDGMHHLRSGGVKVLRSWRVTVADGVMQRAQHRGAGGNGYLWEVSQSGEVLFKDLEGLHGRHNFIQNWGFGTTGCVWLRVRSEGGQTWSDLDGALKGIGASEFHHSLAMANLIDGAHLDDGWKAINRRSESSGAGHTSVDAVLWAPRGAGAIVSAQLGRGLIIGAAPTLRVITSGPLLDDPALLPEDTHEPGAGPDLLSPPSLYEAQLARRLR